MTDKYMKIRSTSYVIRKLQIQTMMRYHNAPIRMVKMLTTPNASEDVKQQELSFIADECEKYIATLEDSVVASYNNVFMP